ncbi:MAG: FAD-dependent thymidylate synthase [Alphaproteobacteria bacterium]|nr:FAD-dependent thymidylate synthase [Alphaproteobacteria bacterium]
MSTVNLVGITLPNYKYTGCDTAEELVAWAARVSNPSNQKNHETAPKLLKYLVKNSHFSPLEMVNIQIEIKTTRDIARQILRHRSFSFQEFSQRYADPTKDLGFVTREARLQDAKNRQASIEVNDNLLSNSWYHYQKKVIAASQEAFNWAIKNGIAKEQARAVLPEGLTESVMIMSGSLRSWVHYCQLRMDMATQKEHRIVAEQCWAIICKEFPSIVDALQ